MKKIVAKAINDVLWQLALITQRVSFFHFQGSRAAVRNLNSKIIKVDHDSLKQQEILYNQDFSIQQLERRINRMQGEQSNEEKLQLEAKIKELTTELDEQTSTHHLLQLQLKRLQVNRLCSSHERNQESPIFY